MHQPPDIHILPATGADLPVVRQLSSYYIYDFSEFMGWPCPESGVYGGCDEMFTDWQAGRNYPYLLRVGSELAGFAVVGLDEGRREFFIEEFFILRKFRRRGIGRSVASRLFEQFYGPWRVEVLVENTAAMRFWQQVITAHLETETFPVKAHQSPWGSRNVFRFTHEVAAEFAFAEVASLHDNELELRLLRAIPSDPIRAWLPTYDFEMRVGGQRAGSINLRVGNTPDIVLYGGHIGYGVVPTCRGHHYAERACRLLFPLAMSHGLTTLWITTNPDNAASRRTCERLGARLVGIVPVPEETTLFREGDREKCRYRLDFPRS